jgi:hypothetical protein
MTKIHNKKKIIKIQKIEGKGKKSDPLDGGKVLAGSVCVGV